LPCSTTLQLFRCTQRGTHRPCTSTSHKKEPDFRRAPLGRARSQPRLMVLTTPTDGWLDAPRRLRGARQFRR